MTQSHSETDTQSPFLTVAQSHSVILHRDSETLRQDLDLMHCRMEEKEENRKNQEKREEVREERKEGREESSHNNLTAYSNTADDVSSFCSSKSNYGNWDSGKTEKVLKTGKSRKTGYIRNFGS